MTRAQPLECSEPVGTLAMRCWIMRVAHIDRVYVRRLLHGSDRFTQFVNHSHDARWFVRLNVAVQGGSRRAIHCIHRAQTLSRHIVMEPPVEELELVRHRGMI